MLFFMGAARGLDSIGIAPDSSIAAAMIAITAVILLIEANGIYGKMGPITSVKGVIHCGVALTVLLYLIICYCV